MAWRVWNSLAILLCLAASAYAQQTIAGERLRIVDTAVIGGTVQHPDYISQLTRWKIDSLGAGDFRYVFTDELHAKSFIADLEQALAGGQIISKSVAMLASNFTVPAAAGAATITVRDLPSAENMAVFESGDTIRLRTFSRASGSLTITDAYGVVTAYADQAGGVQTWTFTRNSGADAGAMTGGTVVQADAIVLDYGVTGNGYHEVNAIDGVYGLNSPYSQVVTWATSPIAANLTVRSRIGNLRGITGTTGEYGAILGTYAATNGQYVRVSNQAVELHGVNLQMWDGSTNVIKLDRTAPSFAIGSPVPSGFLSGTGMWIGKDAGAYKFHLGNPSASHIRFNGTTFAVSDAYFSLTSGATTVFEIDPTVPSLALGNPRPTAYSSGTGVWMGSDSGTYKFRVGNPSGNQVAWDGSTLSVVGSITATSGAIGGWSIGATTLTGGNATLASSGNLTLGTSNNVVRLSADDATYRLWVGHATASSAPFRVTQAGALTATNATLSGSLSAAGTVDIDSSGITIAQGTGTANQVKWSDGSTMYSSSDALNITSQNTITLNGPNVTTIRLSDSVFAAVGVNDGVDLGTSGDPWDNFFTTNARVDTLAGTGTRHVCADAEGDLVVCP